MSMLIQYALGRMGIRTDDDAITELRGERANDWATAVELRKSVKLQKL